MVRSEFVSHLTLDPVRAPAQAFGSEGTVGGYTLSETLAPRKPSYSSRVESLKRCLISWSLHWRVLAACLRFLNFTDLTAASHVSRFWRSSALAFPDLWSRISIDTLLWKRSDILRTAISRARRHPVDLEFVPPGPVTEGMAEAIAEHMDRFVSVQWTYSLKALDCCRYSPLLRDFSCEEVRFRVPRNFLGGSPGVLRTLHLGEAIFPAECLALSTVTHLRATFPEYFDRDAGFQHIFALCPRLESLHLHELVDDSSIELPTRPAPRTLREVMLQSFTGCDLVNLYDAWALQPAQNVQLSMPIDVGATSFLGDALSLSVAYVGEHSEDSEVHIVAQLPGARTRILVWGELTNVRHPRARISDALRAPDARSLTIPLSLLVPVVRRNDWPRLVHVCVHLHESRTVPRDTAWNRFRCAYLGCLCALPALETLELYFYARSATHPLTLDDAQDIRVCLVSIRDSIPREVHIHGFPPEVVHQLPANDHVWPSLVLH